MVKSSNSLRINSWCTWRHMEGLRNVQNTSISSALSRRACVAASRSASTAAPGGLHRSSTPPDQGQLGGRTHEEPRHHRCTVPRDARPTRLSYFRLHVMTSPHRILVGSY